MPKAARCIETNRPDDVLPMIRRDARPSVWTDRLVSRRVLRDRLRAHEEHTRAIDSWFHKGGSRPLGTPFTLREYLDHTPRYGLRGWLRYLKCRVAP